MPTQQAGVTLASVSLLRRPLNDPKPNDDGWQESAARAASLLAVGFLKDAHDSVIGVPDDLVADGLAEEGHDRLAVARRSVLNPCRRATGFMASTSGDPWRPLVALFVCPVAPFLSDCLLTLASVIVPEVLEHGFPEHRAIFARDI